MVRLQLLLSANHCVNMLALVIVWPSITSGGIFTTGQVTVYDYETNPNGVQALPEDSPSGIMIALAAGSSPVASARWDFRWSAIDREGSAYIESSFFSGNNTAGGLSTISVSIPLPEMKPGQTYSYVTGLYKYNADVPGFPLGLAARPPGSNGHYVTDLSASGTFTLGEEPEGTTYYLQGFLRTGVSFPIASEQFASAYFAFGGTAIPGTAPAPVEVTASQEVAPPSPTLPPDSFIQRGDVIVSDGYGVNEAIYFRGKPNPNSDPALPHATAYYIGVKGVANIASFTIPETFPGATPSLTIDDGVTTYPYTIGETISFASPVSELVVRGLDPTLTLPSDQAAPFSWGITLASPGPLSVYQASFSDLSLADFNSNGSVDGHDFLRWQRDYGTVYNDIHLAVWKSAYYQSNSPSSIAIPEPRGMIVLTIAATVLRRRKSLRWHFV